MPLINKPFTHQAHQTAISAQVNANDDTHYNLSNGNLTDVNIHPLAAINQSKIAGLQADLAFINTPAPLRVVVKQAAESGVTNDAGEQPLYAEVVPGGTLGTNNFLHGEVDVFIISILSGATVSVKLYFGGVLFLTAPIANASGATVANVGARIDFRIHGRNSTVSQSASASAFLASSALSFGGIPNLFSFTGNPTSIGVNSALNQLLQVNALWTGADPANSIFGLGFDTFRVA